MSLKLTKSAINSKTHDDVNWSTIKWWVARQWSIVDGRNKIMLHPSCIAIFPVAGKWAFKSSSCQVMMPSNECKCIITGRPVQLWRGISKLYPLSKWMQMLNSPYTYTQCWRRKRIEKYVVNVLWQWVNTFKRVEVIFDCSLICNFTEPWGKQKNDVFKMTIGKIRWNIEFSLPPSWRK